MIAQEIDFASFVEGACDYAALFTIKCLDGGGERQDDGKNYGQLEISLVFHGREQSNECKDWGHSSTVQLSLRERETA